MNLSEGVEGIEGAEEFAKGTKETKGCGQWVRVYGQFCFLLRCRLSSHMLCAVFLYLVILLRCLRFLRNLFDAFDAFHAFGFIHS